MIAQQSPILSLIPKQTLTRHLLCGNRPFEIHDHDQIDFTLLLLLLFTFDWSD